jgi:hypothetical protein
MLCWFPIRRGWPARPEARPRPRAYRDSTTRRQPPKSEATLEHFGFRASAFFRPSDFGFRVWAFALAGWWCCPHTPRGRPPKSLGFCLIGPLMSDCGKHLKTL